MSRFVLVRRKTYQSEFIITLLEYIDYELASHPPFEKRTTRQNKKSVTILEPPNPPISSCSTTDNMQNRSNGAAAAIE